MPRGRKSSLLDRTYTGLGLDRGALLATAESPASVDEPEDWREHGDWLLLGRRLGADRIFFLGDDPVLVFSRLPSSADEEDVIQLYRRAWSMARPRCLFIDTGDVLRVYSLDAPPPLPGKPTAAIAPIEIVERSADVQTALARFHRDRFESGAALEDPELAPSKGRADKRLLRDVQLATAMLQEAGLPAREAHGLIERAILVRYLEDREVLTDQYFDELAAKLPEEAAALSDGDDTPDFGAPSRFIGFLQSPKLTEALFARLARDFNGDLFVAGDGGKRPAKRHLQLLRDVLSGGGTDAQEPLFLWAYDFSVVPTSLVSTMYELFYNEEARDQESSTYYTPPELVEFVLGDVLTPERLDRRPVACDPACGSGIFLVEAYRRIVRHEAARAGRRLPPRRLQQILLQRIAGCDVDESAVRLAAFSLYVTYLNYQTPRDIRDAGPLPPLIRRVDEEDESAPLLVADAFAQLDPDSSEPSQASERPPLPWTSGAFDVVVGNPPWTEPKAGVASSAEMWAKERGLSVGDRSPSQLFLWRALDLLAPHGVAAMLVSAQVLFNTRSTSRDFRRQWLGSVRLGRVVNFSSVRKDYFEKAVAPFAFIRFGHHEGDLEQTVIYETARPVPRGRRGSTALARLDRRLVDQRALINGDHLWTIYAAGDHRDEAFIARLGLETRLANLRPDPRIGLCGYQLAKAGERAAYPPPDSWRHLPSLRTFESWGPLKEDWFEDAPDWIKRDPDPKLFLEPTLVVRRFPTPTFGPHARLLSEPIAFRHTIYGIPLGHREAWEGKVALGTLLSSVGRYWLFMVSGSWGTWKDEIRVEHLLDLPVRLDEGHPSTQRIVTAVDRLPEISDNQLKLDDPVHAADLVDTFAELDEAVGALFDLTTAEADLVNDFWDARRKEADEPLELPADGGTAGTTVVNRYANAFRRVWRPMLEDDAELDALFAQNVDARIIAAIFEASEPSTSPNTHVAKSADWSSALEAYADALDERTANRLLSYGELRAVAGTAIVIVKRNERRLWSPTAARRDAEATAAQLMALRAER